jgi:hypothetical protein|tara:strand:- start:505 stop:756 length:252 start_codon:yes stop_codon:yes gene_type:complete
MTKKKVRHQVKSKFYYLFWGTATTSVLVGQLFVGTSYNKMARSMNRWFEETIDMLQVPISPRGYYAPLVPPPPMTDYMIDDIN